MPVVRRSANAAPVAWPEGKRDGERAAWSFWRNRRHFRVGYRTIPGRHEAPVDDDHGAGVVQTVGPAVGCFACSNRGWVVANAPNGEGLIRVPCPVPHPDPEATDGPEETYA